MTSTRHPRSEMCTAGLDLQFGICKLSPSLVPVRGDRSGTLRSKRAQLMKWMGLRPNGWKQIQTIARGASASDWKVRVNLGTLRASKTPARLDMFVARVCVLVTMAYDLDSKRTCHEQTNATPLRHIGTTTWRTNKRCQEAQAGGVEPNYCLDFL